MEQQQQQHQHQHQQHRAILLLYSLFIKIHQFIKTRLGTKCGHDKLSLSLSLSKIERKREPDREQVLYSLNEIRALCARQWIIEHLPSQHGPHNTHSRTHTHLCYVSQSYSWLQRVGCLPDCLPAWLACQFYIAVADLVAPTEQREREIGTNSSHNIQHKIHLQLQLLGLLVYTVAG